MKTQFQPYSNPTNLEAIRTISREVIFYADPDESISVNRLADRLIKGCEDDRLTVSTSDSENAGGFGDIDLITLVVVPLVATTLGEICKQLVIWSVAELKEWAKKDEENKKKVTDKLEIVIEQKYEEINRKVKSKKTRSKEKAIRSSVKVCIKKYLEIE